MPENNQPFVDPLTEDSPFEWEPVEEAGYGGGIHEMVFYMDDDGSHSRLVRLEPGTEVNKTLVHDFYEEIWIIDGGLIDTGHDKVIQAGEYCCRTPGMEHGPYEIPTGCLSFEHRYYVDGNE